MNGDREKIIWNKSQSLDLIMCCMLPHFQDINAFQNSLVGRMACDGTMDSVQKICHFNNSPSSQTFEFI